MAVQAVTAKDFDTIIQGNEIVIVDFWAPWCGPCKNFAPIFEEASEKFKNVKFVKIDTDVEQELAAAFQIKSIPTVGVFKQQMLLFLEPGFLIEEALNEILTKTEALNMDDVRKDIAEQEKQKK